MASLPPRQFPRRASPPQRQNSQSQQDEDRREAITAPSTTSVDSETILLNDGAKEVSEQGRLSDESSSGQRLAPSPHSKQTNSVEPRKCWICFSEDTEDTPESGVWRTPCPCALTAHEKCLLDWIADMEKPGAGQTTGGGKEIKCPQCKTTIHLARPKSYVVQTLHAMESLWGRMRLPGMVIGVSWGVNIAFYHHGAHTIRMIFGEADAAEILAPLTRSSASHFERLAFEHFPRASRAFFRDWKGVRTEMGLPLIPIALILSRTKFADAILPVIPIMFFVSHPESTQALGTNYWPPSAALTLTLLPYVRGAYDSYMERIWGPSERAWKAEIEPRYGEEDGDGNQNHGEHDNADDDEEMVQLEVGLEVDVDDDSSDEEDADNNAVPPNINRNRQQGQPPTDIEADAARNLEELDQRVDELETHFRDAAEQQEQRRLERDHRHHNHHRHENNVLISGTRVADTILGALLFPTISAAMGEGLKLLLPHSLTTPRFWRGRPLATGLLQTRWGRSIIGGCLFVVLKDAVRIYCLWKQAQAFRNRRVLNWDKATGKLQKAEEVV